MTNYNGAYLPLPFCLLPALAAWCVQEASLEHGRRNQQQRPRTSFEHVTPRARCPSSPSFTFHRCTRSVIILARLPFQTPANHTLHPRRPQHNTADASWPTRRKAPTSRRLSPSSTSAAPVACPTTHSAISCAPAARTRRWRRFETWRDKWAETVSRAAHDLEYPSRPSSDATLYLVDFDSFTRVLNRPGGFRDPGEPEEYCRGFQVFDKDLTGFIGVGQFRYILTNLGEKMSDEEVDELLKAVDTSSGELNYMGKDRRLPLCDGDKTLTRCSHRHGQDDSGQLSTR